MDRFDTVPHESPAHEPKSQTGTISPPTPREPSNPSCETEDHDESHLVRGYD